MTREEAKEILQALKFIVDFENYSDRVEIAIGMGIEALEEQRPHGEWTKLTIYESTCSCCKNVIDRQMFVELPNFCPNCGADMREGEAE